MRGLGRVSLVGALDGVVHEQHVGVAGVAELVTAEPAHRDHRDAGRQRPAGRSIRLATGDLERGRNRDRGDVGQPLLDLLDVGEAEHVGCRDPEQLAPAYAAGDRDGLHGVVVPLDRGRHLRGQRRSRARAAATSSSASSCTASGAPCSRSTA